MPYFSNVWSGLRQYQRRKKATTGKKMQSNLVVNLLYITQTSWHMTIKVADFKVSGTMHLDLSLIKYDGTNSLPNTFKINKHQF